MINRSLRALQSEVRSPRSEERWFGLRSLVFGLLLVGLAGPAWAQTLARRLDRVLDFPPFDRATWGVQHVAGAIVGDGSYFEPQLVHDAWETYDLNWWYAAPVSGLGFNDNSVDISWKPGPRVGAPAAVSFQPDLGFFLFENRSR